jgi:anti-sigma regulatory factor (Ser/Thr protein kinase)
VNCEARVDRLEFMLLEQGEPPDPSKIRGQPLNEVAFSGRGTHLIKAIMDEVLWSAIKLMPR